MTIPMYYEFPTVTECSAVLLETREKGDALLIRLDRSPLFPEGGGQLSDHGSINDVDVFDVRNDGGEAWHYASAAKWRECGQAGPGESVTVQLDLATRLDRAEQHTGEHMLSGLASRLFSAHNVGFHMAEDYCTIDLDVFLTPEQLDVLEAEVNTAVRADLPIHTEVVSGGEAAKRRLRKHAENISGDVRIVYIDNGKVDSCTCCGTHLKSTGMVGAVKITDSQKYKGGTRLWFVCGGRAVRAAASEHNALTALARKFSTSAQELSGAIEKQASELAACKSELKAKSALLAELYAEKLISEAASAHSENGFTAIVESAGGLNMNDLRLIEDSICGRTNAVVLLFAPSSEGTFYRMACSTACPLNMKQLCTEVNAAVGGQGGGNSAFAQGRTDKKVDGEALQALRSRVFNELVSALYSFCIK